MSAPDQRLPQDIANLLAHCIRDLIWYKDNILSFFQECGVPTSIMLQLRRNKSTPTLKLVPTVLDELYAKGDEGYQIARKMLTKIYYWKDIHSVPGDRKDSAVAALKELQKAYKTYMAQEQYKREKNAQRERDDRLKTTKLDHEGLQRFRDQFDRIYFLDPNNGVRLPGDRVFLDVVCGASMATINVFNEAIDKSMGLSCKEANEGVVPDFC